MPNWIQLTKNSGSGDDTTSVVVSSSSARESRTIKVKGTASKGATDISTIIQKGLGVQISARILSISDLSQEHHNLDTIPAEGGYATVVITTNSASLQLRKYALNAEQYQLATTGSGGYIISPGGWTGTTPVYIPGDPGAEGAQTYHLYLKFGPNNDSFLKAINFDITDAEVSSSANIKLTQDAAVVTYSDVEITECNLPDIPASGSIVYGTIRYRQTWGYNGSTTGGGIITSGANIVSLVKNSGDGFSIESASDFSISGDNLSTTVKPRSLLGTATITISLNGKRAAKQFEVYQQQNTVTDFTVQSSEIQYSQISPVGETVNPEIGINLDVNFTSGASEEVILDSFGTISQSGYSIALTSVSGSFVTPITGLSISSSTFAVTGTNMGTSLGSRSGYVNLIFNTVISSDIVTINNLSHRLTKNDIPVTQGVNERSIVYEKPVPVIPDYEDIPASGGSVTWSDISVTQVTFTQSYQESYTSGASQSGTTNVASDKELSSDSARVTASSKRYTVSNRNLVGTIVLNFTANGTSSDPVEKEVYQQANKIESLSINRVSFYQLAENSMSESLNSVENNSLIYLYPNPDENSGYFDISSTLTFTSGYQGSFFEEVDNLENVIEFSGESVQVGFRTSSIRLNLVWNSNSTTVAVPLTFSISKLLGVSIDWNCNLQILPNYFMEVTDIYNSTDNFGTTLPVTVYLNPSSPDTLIVKFSTTASLVEVYSTDSALVNYFSVAAGEGDPSDFTPISDSSSVYAINYIQVSEIPVLKDITVALRYSSLVSVDFEASMIAINLAYNREPNTPIDSTSVVHKPFATQRITLRKVLSTLTVPNLVEIPNRTSDVSQIGNYSTQFDVESNTDWEFDL